jgi:FkbM family methyltransferase
MFGALLRKFRRRPWPASIEQLRNLRISYAQFAEDLVLSNIFGYEKSTGFYVDVGCFEPIQFSNTFIFHQRGWSGLAIDANASLQPAWQAKRPRDTFIHSGVAEIPGDFEYLTYEKFPACNGFGRKERPRLKANATRVPCRPLRDILSERLPANTKIDLLSIDCEGMDLEALRSNDFDRFRPTVLLVEDDSKTPDSEIQRHCESLGYRLHSMCHLSKVFVSRS